MSFITVDRPVGPALLHLTKPVWVVEYAALPGRPRHWQAYRAVAHVPAGRQPWTVDNRRIGVDAIGYPTADLAMAAAEQVAA